MRGLLTALLLCLTALPAQAGLLDLLPLGWIERKLLYAFSPLEESPAQAGLRGVTVHKIVQDGENLIVWSAPPARTGGPVVVYFHGNAGNLAIRARRFAAFQARGYGFVAPAYRGSSGSTGRPSEVALTADAVAVYRQINDLVPTGGARIVYGESLGTAVSVALLDALPLGQRPAGVILEAPFTSIPDMARAIRDVPDSVLARIRDTWDSLGRADALTPPLLVVHGTADTVVPFDMGRAVFSAAASQDKDLYPIQGVGHLGTWTQAVQRRMWRFIDAYGR